MTVYIPTIAPASRRVRKMSFTAQLLADVLFYLDGTKAFSTRTAIPDDLKIVGIGVEEQFHTFALYVESETFNEVPDGGHCPDWHITWDAWTLTECELAEQKAWHDAHRGMTGIKASGGG